MRILGKHQPGDMYSLGCIICGKVIGIGIPGKEYRDLLIQKGVSIDEYKMELERVLPTRVILNSSPEELKKIEQDSKIIQEFSKISKQVTDILYAKYERFPFAISECPRCRVPKTTFLECLEKRLSDITYAKLKGPPVKIGKCSICSRPKIVFDPKIKPNRPPYENECPECYAKKRVEQSYPSGHILRQYSTYCNVCRHGLPILFNFKKIDEIAKQLNAPTWQEAKEDPEKMELRIKLIIDAWQQYCEKYNIPSCRCCGAPPEYSEIITNNREEPEWPLDPNL